MTDKLLLELCREYVAQKGSMAEIIIFRKEAGGYGDLVYFSGSKSPSGRIIGLMKAGENKFVSFKCVELIPFLEREEYEQRVDS